MGESSLQFNTYIKQCRDDNGFTQEKLVEELYIYDIDTFQGLDTNALSKWERGVIKPRLSKQVKILKYFQNLTALALPCFKNHSVHETQEIICNSGMQNLVGKNKKIILDFPSNVMGMEDLQIQQLRNSDMIDNVLEITLAIDKDFNHDLTHLETEDFKKWALHPSNTFYICKYKEQFFGLLFTLRLKKEIFEKIMNFEMRKKDITSEHFASLNEEGTSYVVSFFAMNDKVASMLLIRYYAYLIAHQNVITDIGVATMVDEAKKLIKRMNLHLYMRCEVDNNLTIQTYRESLANFLATENVIKMILLEQDCPEG